MQKRKLSANKFLLLLLTLCLLLSGCVSENANPQSNTNGVQFTDALGRAVFLPQSPKRVVALMGSFADVWVLSGGEICATTQDAFTDYRLNSETALNIGGAHSPNLELLLSADPDFVIASANTASHVEMCGPLENAGITVAYFDVTDFSDYLKMLDVCTDITKRKDLYQANGVKLQEQINQIKSSLQRANIPTEQKKILLLRASAGSIKVKGSSGTVLGEMLSDLGCINIADSDKTLLDNLSIENIIRNQPYRIFVVTMGSDSETAINNINNLIKENPAWAGLSAIKENRLHFMDKELFNKKPNAKWAIAYEKLLSLLCN